MSIKDVLAIPLYAYGDNEAACMAFDELRKAEIEISRLKETISTQEHNFKELVKSATGRGGKSQHEMAWAKLASMAPALGDTLDVMAELEMEFGL